MRDLILGLARPLLRLLRVEERGAIGVLIGIFIGGGVLLGMGALVVDMGFIYSERSQLQNGADAGALAVAKTCALGTCDAGVAPGYVDANVNDHVSNSSVCFGSACKPTDTMTDCPGAPASGAPYVDVHTSTAAPNGSTVIPPFFGRTLLGNGSYSGTTVGACAQAAWGPPSQLNSIAFTISACSWDSYTNQGNPADFGPAPPYNTTTNLQPTLATYPTLDQQLVFHDATKPKGPPPKGCATEPAGADSPGNFGWTATTDPQNCTLKITGNIYGASPGVSGSNCADILYQVWSTKTVVYLPIYVESVPGTIIINGQGAKAYYTLKGFAAFVVTGYNVPGAKAHGFGNDWLDPSKNCTGSTFCINGFFTHKLVKAPPGGGPNLGLDAYALTG